MFKVGVEIAMFGVGRLLQTYSYDMRARFDRPHAKFMHRIAPDYAEFRRIVRNVIVSEKFEYVYIINQKVGCTTICNRLHEMNGNSPLADPLDIWRNMRDEFALSLNMTSEQLENIAATGNYFRFSFVRNPFGRLVSGYEYIQKFIRNGITSNDKIVLFKRCDDPRCDIKTNTLMDFATFAESACTNHGFDQNKHWRSQHELLKVGLIPYDFIGRFETFSSDLEQILTRLGAREDVLERIRVKSNTSRKSKPISDYYDDRLADMVRTHYRKDFEVFGYSKELPR